MIVMQNILACDKQTEQMEFDIVDTTNADGFYSNFLGFVVMTCMNKHIAESPFKRAL